MSVLSAWDGFKPVLQPLLPLPQVNLFLTKFYIARVVYSCYSLSLDSVSAIGLGWLQACPATAAPSASGQPLLDPLYR